MKFDNYETKYFFPMLEAKSLIAKNELPQACKDYDHARAATAKSSLRVSMDGSDYSYSAIE